MRSNNDDHGNGPVSNSLTPAERQRLVELHHETMLARKVEEELRLANSVRAGQIIAQLGKG